ncbi:hypothetical protein [Dysosmobacter sp. Sow4_B12]|uniref:hypothetical protein n=1 Tax=Dysosmobacter sp. Sow4_B12 TaxID=3438777 RepID=UPI003F93A2D0
MEIVDAVWEKTNIGVETKEITIEKTDRKADILDELKRLNAEYLVVKIPSDYESMSFEMAELGFVFIETMHQLSNDLHLKPLSERKQKIVEETDFVKMTGADFDHMCNRIINDCMFRTDRISRDPHFSIAQANRRYVNWLKSERDRGAQLYKYVYRGDNVGFDCFRHLGQGIYDDFLSGIYSDHAGKSLSVNITHKLNDYVTNAGGKKIITCVASTNTRALNHHVDNGYVIDKSNYIFVKHAAKY